MSNASAVELNNLSGFLKDPLAMDAKAIDQLVSSGFVEGTLDDKTPGTSSDAGPTPSPAPAPAAAPAPAPAEPASTTTTTEPPPKGESEAVVQARDGKNVIPFAVLQAEREGRQRAEAQIAELSAKLANAQNAADGGPADTTKSVNDIISPEELAELKKDAPTLGGVLEGLIGRIKELETNVTPIVQHQEVQSKNLVQEAIDRNPKLVYLQASDPDAWNRLVEIDVWARQQPHLGSLSLDDRFAKVVTMYEASYQPIAVPASSAPGKTSGTPDPKAAADAQLAAAAAKAGPSTLTDLPGGNPPARDAVEEAAGMSAAALTDRFLKMNPKEIEAFLGRFA